MLCGIGMIHAAFIAVYAFQLGSKRCAVGKYARFATALTFRILAKESNESSIKLPEAKA